jgi:hypothetical protein
VIPHRERTHGGGAVAHREADARSERGGSSLGGCGEAATADGQARGGALGCTLGSWAARPIAGLHERHRRSYGICLISTISATQRDRTWFISVVVDHPLFTTPPALVLH